MVERREREAGGGEAGEEVFGGDEFGAQARGAGGGLEEGLSLVSTALVVTPPIPSH